MRERVFSDRLLVATEIFPDVFDPAWVTNVTAIAELQCKPRASNPNLFGYFADNELDWSGGWHSDSRSILDWFLLRDTTTPGRTAALLFLKQRYVDIAKLSAAWRVQNCSSWDDLAKHAPFAMTEKRQADCDDFLTTTADLYHNITTSAIRSADPNHMVLGYRYYGIQQNVLLSAAKFVDVIDYHGKRV